MSKVTVSKVTASPSPALVETTETVELLDIPANVTAKSKGKNAPSDRQSQRNLETVIQDERARLALAKSREQLDAKQRLAEAKDTFERARALSLEADGFTAEAASIAEKAMLTLYRLEAEQRATKEETTAVLGDIFGYKLTEKGQPSKTPDGKGEDIRKRIVRAVAASYFAYSGEGGKFFEPLEGNEEAIASIRAIVESINDGTLSLWSAYDQFAEVKREHAARLEIAFDPKKVIAIVGALSTDEGKAKLLSDVALRKSYTALIEVLTGIADEVKARNAAGEGPLVEVTA